VLTGWAGSRKADHFANHSEGEIMEEALHSVANIFDKSINQVKENLREGFVFNWEKEKHAQGAYAYSMPGSPLAKKILNTPIEDTIFFAGEALAESDSPGTVEAALISGKEVAKKIGSLKGDGHRSDGYRMQVVK
jgi:monoamine oxidase